MNSLRKKIGLQFLVSNGATVANFSLSVILARLLTPEDVGIFSMSAILVTFAHVFRDFGVFSYIVKEKEVNLQTIRTALGVLLLSSWSVAAILYFSSYLWSDFFKTPEVGDVVKVLAIGFVFIPFGSIPFALLTRNLEVKRTSKVMAISVVTYFIASIVLAYTGHGHMTMAWANLINIIVTGAAYHWYSTTPMPWIPSLKGWQRITHFGTGSITTSTIAALDMALPDVMLGKMSTPSAVGYFNKAVSAVALPYTVFKSTIDYFALPYLSRLHHANEDMAGAIQQASSYISVIIIPAMVWMTVMDREIILFLFGPQWEGSVNVMPWLCLGGAVAVLFRLTPPALMSIGKPYVAAVPLLLILSIKIALALVLFDGSLVSFGIAMAVGQIIGIPALLFINRHYFGLGVRRWLRGNVSILIVSAATGCVSWLMKTYVHPNASLFFSLLINGVGFLVAWYVCVITIKPPIEVEVRRFSASARGILRRRWSDT
ncbi:oligosaccharide flippase family protein [Hydrogenophaga sp. BPS33]|uniref:oligosaccharide flippase family protein n=1 Tax=Hydrogenophaga sp. BPS33 TaxID=2651974 RepID=UPI001F34FC18|nr:oligosaccharide flippase family protein [Hydrogenophaga sp. BPS33]